MASQECHGTEKCLMDELIKKKPANQPGPVTESKSKTEDVVSCVLRPT